MQPGEMMRIAGNRNKHRIKQLGQITHMIFSILNVIFLSEQGIKKYSTKKFRISLNHTNISCAGIQVIIIHYKNHLITIISSNFIIFKRKALLKMRMTVHRKYGGKLGKQYKYLHAFYWGCFERLVEICFS